MPHNVTHPRFGELISVEPEVFKNDSGTWIAGTWKKEAYSIFATLPIEECTFRATPAAVMG